MNPLVDNYLIDGCGRCPLGGTPQCKVLTWSEELHYLRSILLTTELKEEVKWSVPCYTYQGKNVIILSAFKDNCVLSFFKGALIKDKYKLLESAGEHSQSVRLIRFKSLEEVTKNEAKIITYIKEAIEIEKSGKKVETKASTMEYPEELVAIFKKNAAAKKAFESLTPGRQRGYLLHFTGAKQSATRISRIEKCLPLILKGKGLND